MQETLSATQLRHLQEPAPPEIESATNEDIIAYLRRSHKIAEIAALAERDALILSICEKLDITVSDEELQAAGDAFRLEHKLLSLFCHSKQKKIGVPPLKWAVEQH